MHARRRQLSVALFVAAMVLLGAPAGLAAWPQFMRDAVHRAQTADSQITAQNARELRRVWTRQLGEAGGDRPFRPSPVVSRGVIYMTSSDGRLYAVSAADGRVRWSAFAAGEEAGAPAVYRGAVIVSGGDGIVRAFAARSGRLMWEKELTDAAGATEAAPTIYEGGGLLVTEPAGVSSFDSRTGSPFIRGAGSGHRPARFSSPAISSDLLSFVGARDANGTDGLLAIDSVGERFWFAPIGEVVSSPMLFGGLVYAGSNDGRLYAVERETGAVAWSAPTGAPLSAASPALAGDAVVIGGRDGRLHAYDADTGALRFERSIGGAVLGAPAVARDVIFVALRRGRLVALNAADGRFVWSREIAPTRASPAIAGRSVYISGAGGRLFAYRLPPDAVSQFDAR